MSGSESATAAPMRWRPFLAGTTLAALVAVPIAATAGEGGTSHILPGGNATLVDLLPTSPGWFVKPMYLNYQGDVSKSVGADDEEHRVSGGSVGGEEAIERVDRVGRPLPVHLQV